MNWLAESLVAASLVSAAASICLHLLPQASPRLRLSIVTVGLGAWLVPWGLIRFPLSVPRMDVAGDWINGISTVIPGPLVTLGGAIESTGSWGSLLGFTLSLAAAIGMLIFWFDCLKTRISLMRWRESSRSGEHLRDLIPAALKRTRTEIRIVPGTQVAAASGWLAPTIWLGDQFGSREQIRLALLHEVWHVRRRDPVWISLVTLVKRAYWWNPLVIHLGKHACYAIECACDERCIESYGKANYLENLASMLLNREAPNRSALMASARGTHMDIRRIDRLRNSRGLRSVNVVSSVLVSLFSVVLLAQLVTVPPGFSPLWSHVSIPTTPAGRSLLSLLGALRSGDVESMRISHGAYTPQEIAMPVQGSMPGLELVRIERSDDLSIDYVIRIDDERDLMQGHLELANTRSPRLARSELVRLDVARL